VLGVVGGGAPVAADGAEVHVVVDVVGGEEAAGDAVDEVGREQGPVCNSCFHGQEDGIVQDFRLGLGRVELP
jgi:hypothetical protein